jgi:hypothetical protein
MLKHHITPPMYHSSRNTIHSPHQMIHFCLDVDDKSTNMGFKQCIVTPDGYVVPLVIQGGLPYVPMSKPADKALDTLPHIFFHKTFCVESLQQKALSLLLHPQHGRER